MATRKSSSAKPKTPKARTSKVSTKTTAVKAVAKQAPKVQADRLAFLTLNRLWLAAAVVFGGLAVAAPLLMERSSFMLTQAHVAKDVLQSTEGTVLAPAARPMVDIELRWALSALMALSAVVPVLYLTKLKDVYAKRLKTSRVWEWRWLDLAVTGALMVEIIAMLAGYSDLAALKLMAGLIVLTCGLSWLAERQNTNIGKPDWSAFTIAVLAGALPWVLIGTAHVATLLFGEVRSPWYVYAACLTALTGFILLAVNQYNQLRRFGSWSNYGLVERNYALINVATKAAFVGILIIGLMK